MTKTIKYLPHTLIMLYMLTISILAITTPISVSEANLFYSSAQTPTTFLMHQSQKIFDYEFGFRTIFVLISFLNAWLFYLITRHFFKNKKDKFMALFIYLMLPGTIAESVLVSDAILISLFLSFFILGYLKDNYLLISTSLIALGFTHWSSLEFYLIISIYTLFAKHYKVMLISVITAIAYIYFGGDIPALTHHNGTVKLLAIYATVFSPLFFVYFFFAGYRVFLIGNRDIIWAVSFISLMLSFLMSVYTKIRVEDFSPYLMTGVIVALRSYYHSSRVRLKKFRRKYEISFAFVISMLLLSSMIIIFHQPIYRLLGKDVVTAVSPMYNPYDKSKELRLNNIDCVQNPGKRSINQFRYYGFRKCD